MSTVDVVDIQLKGLHACSHCADSKGLDGCSHCAGSMGSSIVMSQKKTFSQKSMPFEFDCGAKMILKKINLEKMLLEKICSHGSSAIVSSLASSSLNYCLLHSKAESV